MKQEFLMRFISIQEVVHGGKQLDEIIYLEARGGLGSWCSSSVCGPLLLRLFCRNALWLFSCSRIKFSRSIFTFSPLSDAGFDGKGIPARVELLSELEWGCLTLSMSLLFICVPALNCAALPENLLQLPPVDMQASPILLPFYFQFNPKQFFWHSHCAQCTVTVH
jgi:hypothetical protein